MVYAVQCISAGEGTFLVRVVNSSLWQALLAGMGRLAELTLGPAMEPVIFGEGMATLGEVKGLLTVVTAMLDEALVTAVVEA